MDVITSPENLLTTSDLSILLHGVISLSNVMSYDKKIYSSTSILYLHQQTGHWLFTNAISIKIPFSGSNVVSIGLDKIYNWA